MLIPTFASLEGATGALLVAYFAILALLSIYGSHRYLMVSLYKRYAADRPDPEPAARWGRARLPRVTIQLPLYNERYVARRLIEAVARIEYPRERLQIQVLDDSTDDTPALIAPLIDELAAGGLEIALIRRAHRLGYKAGALAHGMESAGGELIAIFDADFVPNPDFLLRTVDHFTDPGVGMVQARWDHINRDYSLLTRVQAVLLDGHFVIEHTARNRSGRFFNFNGTAGVWRRRAIEDGGGWQHDTLTEDLDLSYRTQMAGWRFVFLRDVLVPSEIPIEMNAFKAQQHRWAKGSIQTAKKLLLPILRAPLPWRIKLEAFHHLTANLAYVLMVALAVLMPVATLVRVSQGLYETLLIDLPIFASATLSICYFYWTAERQVGRPRAEIARLIPAVLGVGIGISVNNAKAVLEALVGWTTPFVRTPKYGVERAGQPWARKLYAKRTTLTAFVEAGLAAWFGYAIVATLTSQRGSYFSIPFLLLFGGGFLYVALASLAQGLAFGRARALPDAAGAE